METLLQDKKILVVDDDYHARRLIERNFSHAGAQVFSAANGREGLQQFYKQRPDLVILDVMMPEIDGYETCRQIRTLSNVPVLMLTALRDDAQIVRGLESGADDFVSKPISNEVLLARARAILRRSRSATQEKGAKLIYSDDHLIVDLRAYKVQVGGQEIRLTPKEFRLLEYLMENAGRACTFDQLLEDVWGWEYQGSVDYIHVYVSHLRGKIEKDPKDPQYIQTVHGVGYRFERRR
ncbi:MAG: response regulator transcription factor [Anaerolineales bacterium]|nr:response regulator transcription factor [Anaerolineales bacterium]